ncbi:CarD family transcriptional regulator [Methylobacterium sp. Leaf104]|uniref:Crp/Fnr family transcriptional regulator n=1 Tax=Methylobacterium TaxID=407 RepID=UPI0006F3753F|nr:MULTISPECIES: Crp/Fnr family transcriptional regulator [Methylobacterium]KQP30027.1 CarD family transcriptional regulator [Methylobacterium sp. Leaf104]MCI9881427.1 Crp/Fnr family transcriptional regulator [Methylobacterium goesingense]
MPHSPQPTAFPPETARPDPVRQAAVRNRLLRAMAPEDFARLAPHLEPVAGALHQSLIRPHQPVERLYFPESGFVSIVTGASAGRVEIGLIGREGLVGATPILLDSDRTPSHAYVQNAGRLLALDAAILRAAVGQSPSLRHLLLRFVQVQIVHLGQTAYANATYTMEVRLAAWLLMCHDRVDGDDIAITHAFLALMLGVQRSGATLAVQILEGRHLIRARRGQITILDRPTLRILADGGYGAVEAEYARLIGTA